MRHLFGDGRLHLQEVSFLRRNAAAIQLVAFYGAFALIAAIVFGSMSVHPF
jgi:hypothetical protein